MEKNKEKLWEILVPTVHQFETLPDGSPKPYRTRYHRVWDKYVRSISGGLTIMKPVKGQWIAPDGALIEERMIPVRIKTTKKNMKIIVEYTKKYYNQMAIMYYKVSGKAYVV